jgi:tetratricopeptide (TPR) repeat protein
MSGAIGLNSDLCVGKRKLHLQTTFQEDARTVLAQIFDNGQLLGKRQTVIEENVPAENLNDEVSQLHDIVLSDIELLLVVAQKTKSSKDIASIKKVGSLLLENGFYDEAIEQFQALKKLDKNNTFCFTENGKALLNKGEYVKAIENFSSAIELNPNYPDLYLLAAEAFWANEEYENAIKQLLKAIDINPEYHQAYYIMGLYLLESTIVLPKGQELLPPIERIKQAADHLKMATGLSDQYNKELLTAGFEGLDDRAQVNKALESFKDAIPKETAQFSYTSINSEFYLKFLFAGLDKDINALNNYINSIKHTLSKHSNYADLHLGLGNAYLIKAWHFFAKAIKEYKDSIEINPTFVKANKSLKLAENEGRGFLLLLRAILKQD